MKIKTALIVLLAFTFAAAAVNILENPSFEAGKSGWLFNARPMGADFKIVAVDDAPEGNMAARVEFTDKCNIASLASTWHELEEGEDYTFSVYLKSDAPRTAVTISVWSWADVQGRWNTKTESRKTVFVNQDWQMFSVMANLEKARAGKYQVLIEMRKPAVIYADAAKLKKTSEPTEFAAADIDFGIDFAEPTMFFENAEDAAFDFLIYNRTNSDKELMVNYSVSDFYGKKVSSGFVRVTAENQMLTRRAQPLGLDKKGYYKISVKLLENDKIINEQLASFAVIDKNKSKEFNANSPFGVSISPNNLELQLERAKQIGVEHLRVHEIFRWKDTEVEEGVFLWADEDEIGAVYDDQPAHFNTQSAYDYSIYPESGFDPLIYVHTLKNDYPDWAADFSNEQKLSAYGNFYKALTSHYIDIFTNFEVINEPWGNMDAREYLDILKATYEKSKQGNPDAVMIGVTGYHGPQIDFVKEIIDIGGLDYMDVFSLHPYPRPEPPEPVLIDFIKLTQQWMKDKGRQLPLWITEMGWTTEGFEFLPTRIPRSPARNNTDTEQAQYLVRSNIVSIANGVEVIHWFHYSGDNTWRYTYNIFECDPFSSPMKTIPAFSAMSNFLANADFERKLAEGEGSQYAYLFTEGEKQIIAAWTTCQSSTMQLKTDAVSFDIFDIMGNKIKTVNTGGGISAIEISDSPVYIVSSDQALSSSQVMDYFSLSLFSAPGGKAEDYIAMIKLSNLWDKPMQAEIKLSLPSMIKAQTQSLQANIDGGSSRTFALPITVQSSALAITEYITASANIKIDSAKHRPQSRQQLQYVKPLPKPASGVWIEAEKPAEKNFENSPAWLPNQFRSYGGDNLRFRAMNPIKPDEKYFAEYEFEINQAGEYSILIACSALGDCENDQYQPALSVQINDKDIICCGLSSQIGERWIYSSHRNIWWRFRNAWHDFGKVNLPEGTHRIKLRLGSPPSTDYNYLTIDAITILNEDEKQQFISELEK